MGVCPLKLHDSKSWYHSGKKFYDANMLQTGSVLRTAYMHVTMIAHKLAHSLILDVQLNGMQCLE